MANLSTDISGVTSFIAGYLEGSKVEFISSSASLTDYLLAIAALWAAFTAWRGLGTWAEQQQRGIEFDVMKDFHASFMELKELFHSLKKLNPFYHLEKKMKEVGAEESLIDFLEESVNEIEQFKDEKLEPIVLKYRATLEDVNGKLQFARIIMDDWDDYEKMLDNIDGALDLIRDHMALMTEATRKIIVFHRSGLSEVSDNNNERDLEEFKARLKDEMKEEWAPVEESCQNAEDKFIKIGVDVIIFLRSRMHFNRQKKRSLFL